MYDYYNFRRKRGSAKLKFNTIQLLIHLKSIYQFSIRIYNHIVLNHCEYNLFINSNNLLIIIYIDAYTMQEHYSAENMYMYIYVVYNNNNIIIYVYIHMFVCFFVCFFAL